MRYIILVGIRGELKGVGQETRVGRSDILLKAEYSCLPNP
jgi:hypothetical protein